MRDLIQRAFSRAIKDSASALALSGRYAGFLLVERESECEACGPEGDDQGVSEVLTLGYAIVFIRRLGMAL